MGTNAAPATTVPAAAVLGIDDTPRKPRRFWRRRKSAAARLREIQARQSGQPLVKRKLPSWLVSLIVHVLLLLILALVPIAQLSSGPLTLILGAASSGDPASFELTGADSSETAELNQEEFEEFEPLTNVEQLLNVELPEVVPLDLPTANESVSLEKIPFGLSNGLAGRRGEMKQALLSGFGGTAETEAAVEAGLRWLVKQQLSDGSWSLVGPYTDGGANENKTAATAMALNAFLGAGHTPAEGEFKAEVRAGLAYLIKRQNKDGFFSEGEVSRQQMYAQAIASICVIEAFGMTNDYKYHVPAQRAIDYAEWSQSRLKGWRYNPREDADLSVTGWFVMALETGKMAGLKVDEQKLQSVSTLLDALSHDDQSRYAYQSFEPPSLSMTAEGLLCRIYLGWPRSQPALLTAIERDILPSAPNASDRDTSVYFWYYATQVLHHVGGRPWEEWNDAMKRVLPALQVKSGPEAGSWGPESDMFGPSGGRLYSTCLTIYCLEVYYRHLALYKPQ